MTGYDAYLVRVPASRSANFLEDADAVAAAMEQGRRIPGMHLALDEAWAPLHFVLTEELPIPRDEALRNGLDWSDDPLESAILGGEATTCGTTYGVVRLLSPATVDDVARALSRVTVADFEARYDPDWLRQMNVPMVWGDSVGEERRWLGDHFERLKAFYDAASTGGDAVLSYLL